MTLSETDWLEGFPEVYPVLKKAGWIVPAKAATQVLCPACERSYVDVIAQGGFFYASCDCDESTGRMEIDKALLTQARFDLAGFLGWLAEECGLDTDVAEEEKVLWRLGTRGRLDAVTNYYFARVAEVDVAIKLAGRLTQKKAVLFWLGRPPAARTMPDNVVSLGDLLQSGDITLSVRKSILKRFQEEKFFTSGRDKELDRHIVLHAKAGDCFLLLHKSGNGYEQKVKIRPQTYQLILAAYDVRHRDPCGWTLEELRGRRGIAQNTRTISTRIKELNDLCREHGVKEILQQFLGKYWGLNRQLDCCK